MGQNTDIIISAIGAANIDANDYFRLSLYEAVRAGLAETQEPGLSAIDSDLYERAGLPPERLAVLEELDRQADASIPTAAAALQEWVATSMSEKAAGQLARDVDEERAENPSSNTREMDIALEAMDYMIHEKNLDELDQRAEQHLRGKYSIADRSGGRVVLSITPRFSFSFPPHPAAISDIRP